MNNSNLAFLFLFSFLFLQSSSFPDSQQILKNDKAAAANIIFKSTDGGKTWQDISEGLPWNLKGEGVQTNQFLPGVEAFGKDTRLYVCVGNGLYHSEANSTATFWKKEIFPDKMSSIAYGKAGIYAYNYGGQILQKTNGTNVWSPVYTNFKGSIRTVFETAGGSIFIGSENGLFKSTNKGKTWKQVHAGGWVIKLVESNGVLLATSMSGIIRSTDSGENWELVICEGGVGIDVARIQGGFAAITFNTQSNTRRVRTSYDGGKTWQPIDAGLPASLSISSVIQVGKYLFCGHPGGIFRSSDKGKTWKLILPSIENKVFHVSVSGNVLYAIPGNGGC